MQNPCNQVGIKMQIHKQGSDLRCGGVCNNMRSGWLSDFSPLPFSSVAPSLNLTSRRPEPCMWIGFFNSDLVAWVYPIWVFLPHLKMSMSSHFPFIILLLELIELLEE